MRLWEKNHKYKIINLKYEIKNWHFKIKGHHEDIKKFKKYVPLNKNLQVHKCLPHNYGLPWGYIFQSKLRFYHQQYFHAWIRRCSVHMETWFRICPQNLYEYDKRYDYRGGAGSLCKTLNPACIVKGTMLSSLSAASSSIFSQLCGRIVGKARGAVQSWSAVQCFLFIF